MKKLITLTILTSFLFLTSCMTTKTTVGQYKEKEGTEYTFAKGKQIWVLWGMVPVGRTDVQTPSDGSCEVITKLKFGDVLISGLTAGIVTTQTIKVKAKK